MPNPLVQALVLGVASGMRAAVAPAVVAHHLSRRPGAPLGRLEFMRSPKLAAALGVAAAGELVGDKLPMAPARTEAGPLAGRFASGALCGAALAAHGRADTRLGALVGGVAAVAGAYAFYELRRALTYEAGVPDAVVALAEDALVIGGGLAVLELM